MSCVCTTQVVFMEWQQPFWHNPGSNQEASEGGWDLFCSGDNTIPPILDDPSLFDSDHPIRDTQQQSDLEALFRSYEDPNPISGAYPSSAQIQHTVALPNARQTELEQGNITRTPLNDTPGDTTVQELHALNTCLGAVPNRPVAEQLTRCNHAKTRRSSSFAIRAPSQPTFAFDLSLQPVSSAGETCPHNNVVEFHAPDCESMHGSCAQMSLISDEDQAFEPFEHPNIRDQLYIKLPCQSQPLKKRKKKTRNKARKWTALEQARFEEALERWGRDWERCASHVGTREISLIRSHAQKHFIKLFKTGQPLPRKVAETGDGYTLSGNPLRLDSPSARSYLTSLDRRLRSQLSAELSSINVGNNLNFSSQAGIPALGNQPCHSHQSPNDDLHFI